MTTRIDGDRVFVTGTVRASIFPKVESETAYTIEFDGRGEAGGGAFDIQGSIYGRQLRFRGSGIGRSCVVGRGELVLDLRAGGVQRFLGGLTANGNIEVLSDPAALRDSLVADIERTRVLVRGDVVGEVVYLRDTVVFGNIQAKRVVLERCIVVGAVVAREDLIIRASTVLYYHASRISFEGPCMCLHAMGESVERPVFSAMEDAGGTVYEPSVLYYPVIRRRAETSLSNRPWQSVPPGTATGRLHPPSDWVRVGIEQPDPAAVLRNRPDEPKTKRSERWVLSIAGRAMNFGMLSLDIQTVGRMLQTAFEFDHYIDEARAEARRWVETHCTRDERWVMDQIALGVDEPSAGDNR